MSVGRGRCSCSSEQIAISIFTNFYSSILLNMTHSFLHERLGGFFFAPMRAMCRRDKMDYPNIVCAF